MNRGTRWLKTMERYLLVPASEEADFLFPILLSYLKLHTFKLMVILPFQWRIVLKRRKNWDTHFIKQKTKALPAHTACLSKHSSLADISLPPSSHITSHSTNCYAGQSNHPATLPNTHPHCVSIDFDATGDPEFLESGLCIGSTCREKKQTTKQDNHHPSPLVPASSTSHALQELFHSLNHPFSRLPRETRLWRSGAQWRLATD